MKKTERKTLRGKLLTAIKKVLTDNNDAWKDKTVRTIHKSIKKIARNTDKKEKLSQQKNRG